MTRLDDGFCIFRHDVILHYDDVFYITSAIAKYEATEATPSVTFLASVKI